MYYQQDRENRISVFEDTKRLYETKEKLKASLEASLQGQQLILETDRLKETVSERKENRAKVTVSKKRSFEAASAYSGKKVCVHNFASATNPGGGVTKGSSAQEECLCRCSTLYACLSDEKMQKGFYQAHRSALKSNRMTACYNDDCIYTPGVMVFKSDTRLPELMPEKDWYTVDVITCAAPNLRENPSNAMNPDSGRKAVVLSDEELKALHIKRAERILSIAKANGAEVVILGAFGCGAFQNPPRVVAAAMKTAVEKYRQEFEVIEFAVYCSPRDTENYDCFSRVLK